MVKVSASFVRAAVPPVTRRSCGHPAALTLVSACAGVRRGQWPGPPPVGAERLGTEPQAAARPRFLSHFNLSKNYPEFSRILLLIVIDPAKVRGCKGQFFASSFSVTIWQVTCSFRISGSFYSSITSPSADITKTYCVSGQEISSQFPPAVQTAVDKAYIFVRCYAVCT